MYTVITVIEKGFRYLKTISKLAYYKLKYGSRLKLGKGIHFRKDFTLNISKNGKLEIGDGTFFNNNCSINCHDRIVIGKNNLFGENVKIYDHNHIFNEKDKNIKDSFKTRSIIIGDNNWFGSNVTILSKAEVGNNNVIAACTKLNEKLLSDSIATQSSKLIIEKIDYKRR